MYYVLHRPRGSDRPWQELPGFRSRKDARSAITTLIAQRDTDGSQLCDAKMCVGTGRDRRDILILEGGR